MELMDQTLSYRLDVAMVSVWLCVEVFSLY